jgi:hypothetical protein
VWWERRGGIVGDKTAKRVGEREGKHKRKEERKGKLER